MLQPCCVFLARVALVGVRVHIRSSVAPEYGLSHDRLRRPLWFSCCIFVVFPFCSVLCPSVFSILPFILISVSCTAFLPEAMLRGPGVSCSRQGRHKMYVGVFCVLLRVPSLSLHPFSPSVPFFCCFCDIACFVQCLVLCSPTPCIGLSFIPSLFPLPPPNFERLTQRVSSLFCNSGTSLL